ncbi:hypothetical protein OS493_037863, partial [Desmophyllum pertusum]
VESKLIRDRTSHRSDAPLKYGKLDEKVVSNVSAILGPKCETNVESHKDEIAKDGAKLVNFDHNLKQL